MEKQFIQGMVDRLTTQLRRPLDTTNFILLMLLLTQVALVFQGMR